MKANPEILKNFVTRTKCFMCKRKFDKPLLLPSNGKGINPNGEYLFHMHDTHALDPDLVIEWIVNAVYGTLNFETGSIKIRMDSNQRVLKYED